MNRWSFASMLLLIVVLIFSCKKEEDSNDDNVNDPIPDTGVKFDLAEVPYAKLSDYRFFTGDIKDMVPNERVLPYEPITPLFSDYAHKKRFVWMPEGVSATYTSDHQIFDFPDGSVMVKNFYYDHVLPNDERRIVETRLIYKKDGEWFFADYIWNEEQTEATFSLEGDNVEIDWIDDDGTEKYVNFRIPSEVECLTCHKASMAPTPIAPKPQNLNKDFQYADGLKNQLEKWQEVGYLTGSIPDNIVTTVDWKDAAQPIDLRVRSYLDANCGHCHNDVGHCNYRGLRLGFDQNDQDSKQGICIVPDLPINAQITHIIARSNPLRSAMFYRMNTNEANFMMPMLGRSMVHEEGVELLEQYIESLTPVCP
jgi:uncharacterized repeat protein (TIGR03806 family)